MNTYAAPVVALCMYAPTRAVVPEADKATEKPNASPGVPSEAVSSALRDQVPPRRVSTYAAPLVTTVPGSPARAVVPEADRATESPNSPPAVPRAVSSACWT